MLITFGVIHTVGMQQYIGIAMFSSAIQYNTTDHVLQYNCTIANLLHLFKPFIMAFTVCDANFQLKLPTQSSEISCGHVSRSPKEPTFFTS